MNTKDSKLLEFISIFFNHNFKNKEIHLEKEKKEEKKGYFNLGLTENDSTKIIIKLLNKKLPKNIQDLFLEHIYKVGDNYFFYKINMYIKENNNDFSVNLYLSYTTDSNPIRKRVILDDLFFRNNKEIEYGEINYEELKGGIQKLIENNKINDFLKIIFFTILFFFELEKKNQYDNNINYEDKIEIIFLFIEDFFKNFSESNNTSLDDFSKSFLDFMEKTKPQPKKNNKKLFKYNKKLFKFSIFIIFLIFLFIIFYLLNKLLK